MEHTISLTNCNQRFVVQETETILEAAIRAGISFNYGCSSGSCGLCKARVLKGQVSQIRPHVFALYESDKLQGSMLTCANTACEDLELDAIIEGEGRFFRAFMYRTLTAMHGGLPIFEDAVASVAV